MAKKEALTRAELRLLNSRQRAELVGVKPKYMTMSYWTPREMRKGRGNR